MIEPLFTLREVWIVVTIMLFFAFVILILSKL